MGFTLRQALRLYCQLHSYSQSRSLELDNFMPISCLLYLKPKFLCHAVFTCGGNLLPWYLHFCSPVHLPHPTPEPEPCVYNCLPAPMTAVVETLTETGKVQTITIFLLLLLLDWLSCKHCKRQATHESNVMWDIWPIREEYLFGTEDKYPISIMGEHGAMSCTARVYVAGHPLPIKEKYIYTE